LRQERKTGLHRSGEERRFEGCSSALSEKRTNMQIQFAVFKGCAIAADAAALKRSF